MSESYPSASELLNAVSECLQTEIAPVLEDKALQFKLKIAVNVLSIVEREIAVAARHKQRDREQLADLLGGNGELPELSQQLITAIEAGEFDVKDDVLLAGLQAVCLRQLAIDNPGYSTYQALINDTSVL